MYFVGVDPHRDTHTFCVLDESGAVRLRGKVRNTPPGLDRLHQQFQSLKAQPSECFVLIEASGVYWMILAGFLQAQGYPVCIQPPPALRFFARSGLKRAKTDMVDARTMAEFARVKRPTPTPLSSDPRYRELKEWGLYRRQLVRTRAQVKNRLKRLKHVPVSSGVADCVRRDLKELSVKIREVDLQLESLVHALGGEVLCREIPGAGPVLVAGFLALVEDPHRFPSEKQFRAYAGLAPRISQSGRRPAYARMSRTGGAAYRALLYMAVLSAIRCNPVVRDFYQKKLSEGKARKVALVYAMIKLSQLLFGTWRRYYLQASGGASP